MRVALSADELSGVAGPSGELNAGHATATVTVANAWLPLTYALNAINRSMGAEDLYPFVLRPLVQDKLAFIDGCVRGATAAAP